jgi:hypothetical protein
MDRVRLEVRPCDGTLLAMTTTLPGRLFLLGLTISACTKVDSTDVTTHGMSGDMKVVTDSTGKSDVTVYLQQGDINSLAFIDLKGSDKLTVTAAGSTTKTLDRYSLLNVVSYSASFTGLGQPNTEYDIAFQRSVDAGAPKSSCTVPTDFTITSPAASASFARATQDIVVTYSSSGTADQMRYELSGTCIKTASGTLTSDSGTFTIKKTDVIPDTADDTSASCDITLDLKRARTGTLDAGFGKGGRIECIQDRTLALRTTP